MILGLQKTLRQALLTSGDHSVGGGGGGPSWTPQGMKVEQHPLDAGSTPHPGRDNQLMASDITQCPQAEQPGSEAVP